MKKMNQLMSMLALCAAATMVSCQQEKPVIENVVETGVSKVSVTVGADYDQTKSGVVYENGNRALVFTTGDRLYVRSVIKTEDDQYNEPHEMYILAGYLDATEITDNGTHATFSGDLDVYVGALNVVAWNTIVIQPEEGHWEGDEGEEPRWVTDIEAQTEDVPSRFAITQYNAGSYNFTDPAHLLDECQSTSALLVHENAATNFTVDAVSLAGSYTADPAENVEAFMTSRMAVAGSYRKATHNFSLSLDMSSMKPILNCRFSGFTPGTTYSATYKTGSTAEMTESQSLNSYEADVNGEIAFVFYGNPEADTYHGFRFVSGTETLKVDMGQKSLVGKIYNITRQAVSE